MDAHPAFVGCFTDRARRCAGPPLRHELSLWQCSVAIHLLGVTAAWCCVKAVARAGQFRARVLSLMPPVILISDQVPVIESPAGAVRESSMVGSAFAYAGLAQSDGLTPVDAPLGAASSHCRRGSAGSYGSRGGLRLRPFAKAHHAEIALHRQIREAPTSGIRLMASD